MRTASKRYKKEREPAIYCGQMVYIRPGYIVSMPEFDYGRDYQSVAFTRNKKNLKCNKQQGKLSDKAKKELKNAVNWLIASAKSKTVYSKKKQGSFNFKVNFITLTLPDTSEPITDKFFKTVLLNPFLSYLRSYYNLKNYVWKTELQGNGKIHIHITSDTYIHHEKLKRQWNNLLRKNGCLVDFEKKFGHSDPNSTDVHAVYNIKNLAGYIAEYMDKGAFAFALKKEKLAKPKPGTVRLTRVHLRRYIRMRKMERKILTGRLWGCNYELSQANKTKVFIDRGACPDELKCLMHPSIRHKPLCTVDSLGVQSKSFGDLYLLTPNDWKNFSNTIIQELYNDVRFKIRYQIPEPPPPSITSPKRPSAIPLLSLNNIYPPIPTSNHRLIALQSLLFSFNRVPIPYSCAPPKRILSS